MAEMTANFHGFTLIELLIVVAIIAILAAIAVPNFLEAQTRAKASRVRADMRSIATACEAYHTDNNAYPAGYMTAPRYGLPSLTTPVAFISSANILDPFAAPALALSKRFLDYELVNSSGKIIEAGGGQYSIDPASPGAESPGGVAWWLASRGPDKSFGFQPSNPEYNLREKFYESDTSPEPFLNTLYDPTNGTNSPGNIYRSGGSPVNRALKLMN
jgi:prepilin-type N-terminal cleavage/methylation domain-containing protein